MASYRQDMPPPGGYSEIDWKQRLPRGFKGRLLLAGVLTLNAVGMAKYAYKMRYYRQDKREMMDSRIAVWPFILAEIQRQQMVQWRTNRDEENELMKEVEGWETGTLYGEKIYIDEKRYIPPSVHEFVAHMDPGAFRKEFMKRFERN